MLGEPTVAPLHCEAKNFFSSRRQSRERNKIIGGSSEPKSRGNEPAVEPRVERSQNSVVTVFNEVLLYCAGH